jgi:hypothetical protein
MDRMVVEHADHPQEANVLAPLFPSNRCAAEALMVMARDASE